MPIKDPARRSEGDRERKEKKGGKREEEKSPRLESMTKDSRFRRRAYKRPIDQENTAVMYYVCLHVGIVWKRCRLTDM